MEAHIKALVAGTALGISASVVVAWHIVRKRKCRRVRLFDLSNQDPKLVEALLPDPARLINKTPVRKNGKGVSSKLQQQENDYGF